MEKENRELKARFCQQYFTTMLTMVNRCDVQNDDFGLRFLCEALPEEVRSQTGWLLEGDERVREEELMLGLEEFWMITDEHRLCNYRNQWVRLLSGQFHDMQADEPVYGVTSHFVGVIFQRFGSLSFNDLQCMGPCVRQMAKALNLLQAQDGFPNILKVEQQRCYALFAISVFIGLTTALRQEWERNEIQLSRWYTPPARFLMPEQQIEVRVRLENADNQRPGSEKSDGWAPAHNLSFTMKVRKYSPIKVDITFGCSKYLKTRIDLDQQTLSYYNWDTCLEVIVPTHYESIPLQITLIEGKNKENVQSC